MICFESMYWYWYIFTDYMDSKKKSERPVDALAEKTLMTHSLTDNLKSRDASASKKSIGLVYPQF